MKQFRADEGTRAVDVGGERKKVMCMDSYVHDERCPKITPINPEKDIGELHWMFILSLCTTRPDTQSSSYPFLASKINFSGQSKANLPLACL